MLYFNNNHRVHLLYLIQVSAENAMEQERSKYDQENFQYNLQDGSELKTQQELNEELEAFYRLPLSERCVIL